MYCTQIWPRKMRAMFPSLPDSRCHYVPKFWWMNKIERKWCSIYPFSFLLAYWSGCGHGGYLSWSVGWRRHKAERARATVDFLGPICQISFDFYMRNKETPVLFRHYFVLVLFVFLDSVILDHCYRESKLTVTSLIFQAVSPLCKENQKLVSLFSGEINIMLKKWKLSN